MVLAIGPPSCPAEHLLDPFANFRRPSEHSRAPRGAAIERRALGFGRHVRAYVHGAQLVDEVLGVVALVRSRSSYAPWPVRRAARSWQARGIGMAIGLGKDVHGKAITVFHQGMAHMG